MNRRIFLRGLGTALLAANLWLMPRSKEPCCDGSGVHYSRRLLPNVWMERAFIKAPRRDLIVTPLGGGMRS